MNKTERVKQEARALWIEAFGEAPSQDIESAELLRILLERMEPKAYTRLTQAQRARDLTFPR